MKKFFKNPQNVIIAFLVAVIAVGGTAMGTGAWFTDTNNVSDSSLRFGTIDVSDDLEANNIIKIATRTVDCGTLDIMPDDTLKVDFTLTNVQTGGDSSNLVSEAAWIKVTIDMTGIAGAGTATPISGRDGSVAPKANSSTTNVFYYDLQSQGTVKVAYDFVLTGANFDDSFQDDAVDLTVRVDAIQQANITGFEGDTNRATFGTEDLDYIFNPLNYVSDFDDNGTLNDVNLDVE